MAKMIGKEVKDNEYAVVNYVEIMHENLHSLTTVKNPSDNQVEIVKGLWQMVSLFMKLFFLGVVVFIIFDGTNSFAITRLILSRF